MPQSPMPGSSGNPSITHRSWQAALIQQFEWECPIERRLLLRRGLQCGDVELYHFHHRGHRLGMLQDLADLLRHDLPAQAELVRQPTAGHGFATLKQLVPVAVDLGLVLARDGVRESRRERVRWATVEERHLLAHQFDGDSCDLSGGPWTHTA